MDFGAKTGVSASVALCHSSFFQWRPRGRLRARQMKRILGRGRPRWIDEWNLAKCYNCSRFIHNQRVRVSSESLAPNRNPSVHAMAIWQNNQQARYSKDISLYNKVYPFVQDISSGLGLEIELFWVLSLRLIRYFGIISFVRDSE